ncbi:hypothetical protein [Microbacterium aureliae]
MTAHELHAVLAGDVSAVGLALALMTTLATICAFGFGFLLRPTQANLLWSAAIALAAVASCGVVAADAVPSESLRLGALGLFAGLPALVWSGARSQRGARPFVWIGPVMAGSGVAAMLASGDESGIGPVWRLAVLAASVFSALVVVEWIRWSAPRDRFTVPLVVASGLYAVMSVTGTIAGVAGLAGWQPDAGTVRLVRIAFIILYLAAVLLAVVGPALRALVRARRIRPSSAWDAFEERAHATLVRGQETGTPWSLVYVQVDDADEVRQTAGAPELSAVTGRIERALQAAFPDAQLASPTPGVVVVLAPGPNPQMRERIRSALARISRLAPYGRLPVRPSASAGWAPASSVGYDLTVLLYLAAQAAANAEDKGGDRWERVGPATVLGTAEPTGVTARMLRR